MKKITILVSVIILLGCSINVDDLKNLLAQECIETKDITPQCKISKDKTLIDIEKISSLGILYLFGHGVVKQDYVKSFNFLKVAEKFNDPEAINGLGVIYMLGLGRVQDFEKAELYLKKANELGEKNSKNNLGELFKLQNKIEKSKYWFNLGVYDNPEKAYEGLSKIYLEQNKYKEAYEFAHKAAKYNNAESEYNLGVFYEQGIYVDKNIDKAVYWYTRAGAQGHLDAQNNLRILKVISGVNP